MKEMKYRFLQVAVLIWGSAGAIFGQQTIFNVPSSDVLDAGKSYIEIDATFKVDGNDRYGRFSGFIPRIVVGVGSNVEIGFNLAGNVQPGRDVTTLVPTIKWKFYESKKNGVALFAGSNFYIPVRERAYNFGSYSYAAVSKTISKTRITAGGYVASRNVIAPNAVRAGGQFGIERPINDKVTIAADWITGDHANGYLTPGVIYKPHPRVTTYWSYSIGNAGALHGNHFFLLEVGYNLD